MARALSDELSPAAGARQSAATVTISGEIARVLWAAGVGLAGACGGVMGALLAGSVTVRPELTSLLHGIVAVKGLIWLACAALVLRRLGGAVDVWSLAGYAAGLGLSAGALAWLWGLSGLLAGSLCFYAGLLLAYLTASRDSLISGAFHPPKP